MTPNGAGRCRRSDSLRRESFESMRCRSRNPLRAKIVDVDIYDDGHGFKIEFPYLRGDGGAGNGLALVAHRKFEQRKQLVLDLVAALELLFRYFPGRTLGEPTPSVPNFPQKERTCSHASSLAPLTQLR